jgi:hypothetical protein
MTACFSVENHPLSLGLPKPKETHMIPAFTIQPAPTTFIVNVIHVHPGKQEEAFQLIQNVVRYVAEQKPGFLWSNLAKSTDGLTVVNIEAISDAGDVGIRGGSVCLNSFGRFAKWISASIMPPPSWVPAR